MEPPLVNQADMPLTTEETIKLALGFCFLWFVANWTLNAALAYTSVASATILSGMSGECFCYCPSSPVSLCLLGMMTLTIGRMFRVEKLTLVKIGAVLTAYVDIVLLTDEYAHPSW